jgi:hypothetical protein
MFHVPKEEFMGCAIASAAIIADLSYDEAASFCGGESAEELRWVNKFPKFLETVTKTRWVRAGPLWPCLLGKTSFPDFPVAALIRDQQWFPNFGQWIVIKGKLVHDPGLPNALLMHEYPFKGWYMSEVLRPKNPADLRKRQFSERLNGFFKEITNEIAVMKYGSSMPTAEAAQCCSTSFPERRTAPRWK